MDILTEGLLAHAQYHNSNASLQCPSPQNAHKVMGFHTDSRLILAFLLVYKLFHIGGVGLLQQGSCTTHYLLDYVLYFLTHGRSSTIFIVSLNAMCRVYSRQSDYRMLTFSWWITFRVFRDFTLHSRQRIWSENEACYIVAKILQSQPFHDCEIKPPTKFKRTW